MSADYNSCYDVVAASWVVVEATPAVRGQPLTSPCPAEGKSVSRRNFCFCSSSQGGTGTSQAQGLALTLVASCPTGRFLGVIFSC